MIKSKPRIFSSIFQRFDWEPPDVLPTLEAYRGGLRMDVALVGVFSNLQEVEDAHSVSRFT